MPESNTGSQAPAGVKYIIWAVLGVIAILVTVKELGFTPTKITTPGVSVELKSSGGIAPKAADDSPTPSTENTAELAARVKELENQLRSGSGHSAPADTPASVNPPAAISPAVNVAGNWVGPVFLNITQNGSSIITKMMGPYGNLLSVGQGTVNGSSISVGYKNNLLIPGTLTATISSDGQQMNVTDYGKGFPQYFVFRRQ